MKKRLAALLMVLVMTVSLMLSGCGEEESVDVDSKAITEEKANSKKDEVTDANAEVGLDSNINATGLPIVNETVTLKVAARKRESNIKPWDEAKYFVEAVEATNVEIDWDVTPTNAWNEKKNLMIASGDWPDIFYGAYILNDNEVIKLASEGVLMPIEDLIDNYAPNIKKIIDDYPGLRELITAPDGHIYALPSINSIQSIAGCSQFINQEWLDEVGMDVPTTTDEFYEMLKAFKEIADEDVGEVPFTFRFENNTNGINGMFGSFGISDNASKLTLVEDEIVFTPTREEYKEAIQYFHKLFDEGLMDVEAFSQNVPVLKSKITNKTAGAVSMWSVSWIYGADYKEAGWTYMAPLKGPNGDYGFVYNPNASVKGKGSFSITTTCENPIVAIKWADYMANPEVSYKMFQGDTVEKGDDGIWRTLDTPDGISADEFRHAEAPGAQSFHMLTSEFYENVELGVADLEKIGYDNNVESLGTNPMIPPYFLSSEEAQRTAELSGDIDAFVKEKTATWLLEGGIEDEWEDFQAQLKKMGVEEIIEIHNARYQASK